jgi:hypothetical protein
MGLLELPMAGESSIPPPKARQTLPISPVSEDKQNPTRLLETIRRPVGKARQPQRSVRSTGHTLFAGRSAPATAPPQSTTPVNLHFHQKKPLIPNQAMAE